MRSADTVIVGAGQAGLALSRWLSAARHDHVLLERGEIGERWRSERWESLSLLTPNWANHLPGAREPRDADAFLGGGEFAAALERYARSFGAPVHEATTVTAVEPAGAGYRVRTDRGDWAARAVVVASGDCAVPAVPWFAQSAPLGVEQRHAARYRAPAALPAGGVLVVGSGPSGHQIAHELAHAGRRVVLAVGRHARVPRRYRGRDLWTWLRDIGDLGRTLDDLDHDPRTHPAATLPLDGRDGGRTLDLGVLAAAGVRVTGRLEGFAGTYALFGGALGAEVEKAEERMRRLLGRIDDHIARTAALAPAPDPVAPIRLPEPPSELDLAAEGITSIVWATGYRPHYPWLRVPAALADDGGIVHERGVTPAPGLFVLGTRWQFRTTSHQIGGVGEDARHLAARIVDAARAPLAAAA